jgi:hypothetical protein
VSLGVGGEKRRRQILQPVPMWLWMLRTLPLAAFAGLRVEALDEKGCTVRLPGGWRTRNPFRSTYFAAQAMAAEMSTAAVAVVLLADVSASIAMLPVALRAAFTKKIVGPAIFRFEDGLAMKSTIDRAASSDEPAVLVARSTGRDEGGAVCAEFDVTWSFKRRTRG